MFSHLQCFEAQLAHRITVEGSACLLLVLEWRFKSQCRHFIMIITIVIMIVTLKGNNDNNSSSNIGSNIER